jgi:site-specific DNA recombinase
MNGRKQNVPMENTAVVYSRFSSHNQREESIDAQERACTAYAKSKNLQIVNYYADSAKSGTNADREEFLKMIADSGKGKFRYLIIHKLDRFSRDKFDAVTYKRKLKMNGVTVLSVTENLDDSPESIMLESVLEGMSAYYSLNLAREVRKGMAESAYKCTHLGGIPPLGYDVDPITRKYIINDAEAAVVRYIFKNYSEDVGYNGILEYLNSMGFRSKRGKCFGKNSLYGILGNEKYTGKFIFNKKLEKDVSGKRNPQWKPREEWIVVDNGLPRIIDQETFDIVQHKLQVNRKSGGRFSAKELYLLSGLIFCGECGAWFYGNTRRCGRNKSRYSSYRCANRANHKGCRNKEVRREYIENFVLDELYQALFSANSIAKLAAMLTDYNRKKSEEQNGEVSLALDELKGIDEKVNKIVQLVSESGVAIDTVKSELRRLEDRKVFLEGYLQEMHLKNSALIISEEKIIELIQKSKEFVKTRNIAECGNFIRSYVERVVVYNDKVEVLFKVQVPDDVNDSPTGIMIESDLGTLKRNKVLIPEYYTESN